MRQTVAFAIRKKKTFFFLRLSIGIYNQLNYYSYPNKNDIDQNTLFIIIQYKS